MAIRSKMSAPKWLAGSVLHQGVEMAHQYTGPLTRGNMYKKSRLKKKNMLTQLWYLYWSERYLKYFTPGFLSFFTWKPHSYQMCYNKHRTQWCNIKT